MASEFEESSKFEGSPKLSTNSEPVAWMTVEEDGTRHGLRGWSDGTHREVPLYMAPPDHREAMRLALDALDSFDGVGDVVTWEKQGAKCYTAIAVLRSALGEKK
jgi:hypothetical protein